MKIRHASVIALMVVAIVCAGCEPMNAIQTAADEGSVRAVDALLARGADINMASPVHGTALSIAVQHGDTAMVKHLIDHGADVNLCSPLSSAAWGGNEDLARLLIEKGADVDKGWNSDSPLEVAAKENKVAMVALLLATGAKPNGGRDRGEPLYIASFRGYDEIVRKLLDAHADPRLCKKCLDVSLRYSPSLATAGLLLAHGADANARDETGGTPLHAAATRGRVELVRLLLAHDAKPEIADNSGKTAGDFAHRNGDAEIEALLAEAGATKHPGDAADKELRHP